MQFQIRSIVFDKSFERNFKKYKEKLTEQEKDKLRQKLMIFKKDPFDKRLKTHKLKGELKKYWGFWVNHSDRVVFRFIDDQTVFFIIIGDHSIYKKANRLY